MTKNISHIKIAHIYLWMISLMLISYSCSVTKHLENDEKLLTKNNVSIKNSTDINSSELENYIQQNPNRKTLGVLFHLRIYNLYKHNDNKIGSWMRKTIGEKPVIYDSAATKKTINQFNIYLKEQGYYNSIITYQTKDKGIHNQKKHVTYTIHPGTPYTIDSIQYAIPDSNIAHIIHNHSDNSPVQIGENFKIKYLLDERKRLSKIIKNKGYYSFSPQHIYFTADTSHKNHTVHLTLGVQPYKKNTQEAYPLYKIDKTIIYPDFSAQKTYPKTLKFKTNTHFKYTDSLYVKPHVITQHIYIQNNALYNISDIEKTQKRLTINPLFRTVDISFEPSEKTDSSSYIFLNCIIKITPVTQQAFTLELEGTNTAGDWGAETNITYSHKNIFHGAESFHIKLSAAAERNMSLETDNSRILFNSQEYGIETRLKFPQFLSPIKPQKFDKKYKPNTSFLIQYNYNNTQHFIRPTSHFSYGYTWFGNNYLTHYLNPVDISYIRYEPLSNEFKDFISSNDYYKYSYEDYLIYSSNYSLVFYNKSTKELQDYYYLKLYFESSGNSVYAMHRLLNSETDTYKTFNVAFAQYIKTETDFRYYYPLTAKNTLVYRIFGGITTPYLNSDWVPSIKKYYAGGANSMRGWTARTLGPGAHKDTLNTLQYNLGDIKIETNFEARFKLFWILEGAAFIDIGNIWSFNNNDMYNAKFTFNNFINELAISSGIGLRFDLSFLIFRTDVGVKFREPYPVNNTDSHIIWGNRTLNTNDFNISIGIGYPF
ncbi:MAG: BamA/TamA family outer membrane protein [Bacteroidales bacterium]